jgi:hypothetical protein
MASILQPVPQVGPPRVGQAVNFHAGFIEGETPAMRHEPTIARPCALEESA